MIKKNNELSGYMLLKIEQELPYRGVDRIKFEPSFIESEMSNVVTERPRTYIYEFYPPGWRRTAYRIFENNMANIDERMEEFIDIEIVSNIQAAKEIQSLVEENGEIFEIVKCQIFELEKGQTEPLTGVDQMLGYDLAYPGGDYYSAIRNGMFINPDKNLIDRFLPFTNEYGLFKAVDHIQTYLEAFRKSVLSEANSSFVVYAMGIPGTNK